MNETDELGGLQFLEIRSSLPDELLMYGDKLSMAHGLEARVPYLDQDIVEYVERLSASFKVNLGSRKWLHRRLCRKFLPRQITQRKKLGFATPIDKWFRKATNSKINDLLAEDQLIYQYLQPHIIRKLIKDHQNSKSDNHKILFSILMLEYWLRIYKN